MVAYSERNLIFFLFFGQASLYHTNLDRDNTTDDLSCQPLNPKK